MSESTPAIDDVDPPWGSLAIEKYLLVCQEAPPVLNLPRD